MLLSDEGQSRPASDSGIIHESAEIHDPSGATVPGSGPVGAFLEGLRGAVSEVVPDFRFDPDAGAYLASLAPRARASPSSTSGSSSPTPTTGCPFDHTGDADPATAGQSRSHPPSRRSGAGRRQKGGEIPNEPGLEAEIAAAWQGEKPGPRQYRHEPNYSPTTG